MEKNKKYKYIYKEGLKAIEILILFMLAFTSKKIDNNIGLNLISLYNITTYNMVRFVNYEFLNFNSLFIFKYFRKKYFNITSIVCNYDDLINSTKIEYDFEIYNENKTLINPSKLEKLYKVSCFMKVNDSKKLKKSKAIVVDDKYFKCIIYYNISNTINLGIDMFRKKYLSDFKLIIKFNKIFNIKKQ